MQPKAPPLRGFKCWRSKCKMPDATNHSRQCERKLGCVVISKEALEVQSTVWQSEDKKGQVNGGTGKSSSDRRTL
jgi:hypothetical protein